MMSSHAPFRGRWLDGRRTKLHLSQAARWPYAWSTSEPWRRARLALIRRTSLLVGAHGAGLLWNLFLPEGAALVELLNLANANQYYANHCRWARRRYGKWQNTDVAREERALDPLTREPVDPFRNHMRVMVDEVVRVAVGVLNQRWL